MYGMSFGCTNYYLKVIITLPDVIFVTIEVIMYTCTQVLEESWAAH